MTTARPSGSGQMEGESNISLLHRAVSPFWHGSIISSVLSFLRLRVTILNVKVPTWLSFRPFDSVLSSGRDIYIYRLCFSHTWWEEYGRRDVSQQRSCQESDVSAGACSGPSARSGACRLRGWQLRTHTYTRRQTHTHTNRHCCHQSR